MVAASSSLWLVIGSSRTFGSIVLSWFHDIFTLFFLLSAVFAIYELEERRLWTLVQLSSAACALSAIACGLALNFLEDDNKPGAKIGLAISEVLFVLVVSGAFARQLFLFSARAEMAASVSGPLHELFVMAPPVISL
jgi:peptidoglycan/LPS O-acetylase OafA/YrhL